MKVRIFTSLLLFLLSYTSVVQAAVMPRAVEATAVEKRLSKKEQRRQARMERRKERLEKRLDRMEDKLADKKEKRVARGIWDDSRFRLGVLLLLGALALALVGALINLSFFGFLAGLVALAGIILMIWSLVEY